MGNKPFVDKKGFYANSNVMLNRKLSELSDWDEKTLIPRKKHLIKMSKKVFSV
ncbi:MAG: HNH endonuclease [Tolypothrix sp. T3-bin4]|nr:HNH endonuclease [Tolypothrix sp. T3-bin4]